VTASAIYAGAASSLRTRSPSPVLGAVVRSLRVRSPSPIFSDEINGIPGSAMSAPVQHTVDADDAQSLSASTQHTVDIIPPSSLSQPAQHTVEWRPGHSTNASFDHWTEAGTSPDTGPVFDHATEDLPGSSSGTIFDHLVEVTVAGIPGKQIATGARGIATANIVDDAVTSAKLAAGAVDATALAAAAFGNGLAGGGGTIITVDPDTGITVSASGVAFDTTANLTMTGTHSHTPDTLQVVGAPNTANDAVNKNYVDNAVAGLTWKNPVCSVALLGNVVTKGLIGNATIATLNGLSPAAGDAYVATDAGTPTAGTSDALVAGSLAEFDGTQWKELLTGSGGFVPAGFATLSTTVALIAPYTDVTDDGKIAEFDGTGLTGTLVTPVSGDAVVVAGAGVDAGSIEEWSGTAWVETEDGVGGFVPSGARMGVNTGATAPFAPYVDTTDNGKIVDFTGASNTGVDTGDAVDGNAVLVQCELSVNENQGYVFDGVVATGSWVQFSGGGLINAGTGLTKSGNTINAIGGDGITANANDLAVDLKTSGGLKIDTGQIAVEPADFAGTGLEDDGADNLRLAAQGNGIAGGAGSTLSVNPDTTTGGGVPGITVGANGVGLSAQGNGIAGGAGTLLSVEKDTSGSASAQADAVAINVASTGIGIDGDKVEIDWTAANYTPTDVAETDDAGQLAAHLKGIDLALASAGGAPTPQDKNLQPAATTGDAQDSTINITSTPQSDSYVAVLVNGVQVYLADDNTERTTADCYFSADGGTTARAIEDIAAADSLYWNGTQAGYDLDTNDAIDLNYNV